jgi:hypothetical protein
MDGRSKVCAQKAHPCVSPAEAVDRHCQLNLQGKQKKIKSGKGKEFGIILRNSIPHILGILMKKYSLLMVPGTVSRIDTEISHRC